MFKRKICYLFLMFFLLLLLSGCKDNTEDLKVQKGVSEVNFLENQICMIFSKFFSGEFLDEEKNFDWNKLSEDYVILEKSIDVILIDFASFQVLNEDIINLENNFKDMNSFIKSKDSKSFLQKMCDTYSLVSNNISKKFVEDENIRLEKNAKSNLMYVGYYILNFDRENAILYLDNFENSNSLLNQNKNYLENNSYKINKIFINIQRLKNFLENENFEEGKRIFIDILNLNN